MNTYQNQLRADIERIDAEHPAMAATEEADIRYAERSGRFGALAHYYAGCADFEAAQRQRLGRDPKALIATFCGQIAGPSAEDITILLGELHAYLRLRPELEDVKFSVEEATHAAEHQAGLERERAEEAAAEELASNERRRANLIERGVTTC
jgi:hypothetical protein